MLKDKEGNVRSVAANALGQLRDPAVVGALLALLKDKDGYVRYFAALALGQLRDSAAVGALLALFKDKEVYVRSAAANALGLLQLNQDQRSKLLDATCGLLRDEASTDHWSLADGVARAHLLT